MAECLCVDCVREKSLQAKGLTSESVSTKKQISFKTNADFFASRYQGFFYGSGKPYLDGDIISFLDTHTTKGIRVTLTVLESNGKVRRPRCKSHKKILKLLKEKPMTILELMEKQDYLEHRSGEESQN